MAQQSSDELRLPKGPIDHVIEPIERFLHVEAASGIALLACTLVALVLANSPVADHFLALWKTPIGFAIGSFEMRHSLQHWINDGLMAIFFFVIGLEVKREIVRGELRDVRRAALPIAAALGGMIVPAGIYLLLQHGQPTQSGWGIPMATDIAFVVGCMAVLGPRVPHGFRVMILSLAIADDIGAILVIAIGYTESIHFAPLALGLAGLALVFLLWRIGVRSLLVHAVVGVLAWLAFHESGVHATIAGVLLGLLTPTGAYVSKNVSARLLARAGAVFHGDGWSQVPDRAEKVRLIQWAARESISPVEYLEGTLHPWVSFMIMPVFALANAGVPVRLSSLSEPVAMAVAAGLVLGKPVGIVGASWLAVRTGIARLPGGVGWAVLTGGGFLAGIGFTMALFIAGLALEGPSLDSAKVGILGGSLIAAVVGMAMLAARLPKPHPAST
jgi:NhaA family Na+:H+ antiporter